MRNTAWAVALRENSMKTNDRKITDLMATVHSGKTQLPDFQRGWVWDDNRIKALIASITNGYPVGAAMFLEYGNENIRFKYRVIEGSPSHGVIPDELILDGQQRLTSIYTSLFSDDAVNTRTEKGQAIKRYYYIDMAKAVDSNIDRVDSILSVPENRKVTSDFGRKIDLDVSSADLEYEQKLFPLNIILDPLFMFLILPKGREALGAAIATALSNVISCIYFILVIYRLQKEKSTVLSFRFAHDALIDGSAKEILLNGLPACLMTLFENVSYAVLDHLMAFGGMEAQAGLGVAKKVNMLAHCMVRGMSQGVLPLIAFNYSAGNYRRMKDTIRVSVGMSVLLSLVTLVLCFTFSRQLIGIFIRSESMSLAYGTRFLRILCLGCPFSAFAYAIISFFQAVGKSGRSFVLAVCRKGALDIPMMFVLFRSLSVRGVVWATPITDIICCTAAFMLYRNALKNMKISLWNKDLNSEIRADDTILLQRNAKHA